MPGVTAPVEFELLGDYPVIERFRISQVDHDRGSR